MLARTFAPSHRARLLFIIGSVLALGITLLAQTEPPVSRSKLPSGPQVTTYFIDEGTADTGYKPSDRQLATWALQAWERSSGGVLRFESAPEMRARIRVYWAGPNSGQYGEMRSITVDGQRGAEVYVRPDTEALGPDIAALAATDPLVRETIVYLTCLHELGHALGLNHTSNYADIMYFFGFGGDIPGYFDRYRRQLRTRDDIATMAGLSIADIARVRAIHRPQ